MTFSPNLRPDCGNCFALCCTALGFTRSADFAIDKPAAVACPNMADDFSCSIHQRLLPRGFRGCTVFDCFGAGQVVSQGTFAGTSWTQDPSSKSSMFAVFKVVRQLHEMLWYLAEARQRTFDPDLASTADHLSERIAATAQGDASTVLGADVETLHGEVRVLLMEVSEELRASYGAEDKQTLDGGPRHLEMSGADLMGANLANRGLCGADLRSAYLIGANLRNSDLTAVDLLGADLRGAQLHGADLSKALYLTQPQINAAEGDSTTLLPERLTRPTQW
ncbi:pentapeptide repeat-containing protein [Paenarthrobacter aurescens]|uniref:pentapeptide repeat-containing protein n=1 Tax=Paenarthrobacter aurescens TaxID=43663 RepID=UPI0021BF236B|nr:pentapeptide repeat-containing protein [Paenarthrobacter aurescens]MCT9868879.1 pentapeptide repeat-containing protein [Paenarthrobacter aurescens]